MCHLELALLVIEATQKAVVVQDMTSWPRLREYEITHVEDYGNGWWYSIKYFAHSNACERLAVTECFVCHWVRLNVSFEHVYDIIIGGFERRYDTSSMKKTFMGINGPKGFKLTKFSWGLSLSHWKRQEIRGTGLIGPRGPASSEVGIRKELKWDPFSPTRGMQLRQRRVECDLKIGVGYGCGDLTQVLTERGKRH